jgi:hypothetical protein
MHVAHVKFAWPTIAGWSSNSFAASSAEWVSPGETPVSAVLRTEGLVGSNMLCNGPLNGTSIRSSPGFRTCAVGRLPDAPCIAYLLQQAWEHLMRKDSPAQPIRLRIAARCRPEPLTQAAEGDCARPPNNCGE